MLIGVLHFEEFPSECQSVKNGSNCHQRRQDFVASCYPSGTLYSGFGWVLKELKHTISSSDVLPSSPVSDKFESAGVDFRCLPENVSLVACKISVRALEAFRFYGMAENKDNGCFQGHN